MTQLEDGHLDASELYLAACEGASPARLAELAAWSPYVVQAAVGRAVRCAELQGAQLDAPVARLRWAEEMCTRRRRILERPRRRGPLR